MRPIAVMFPYFAEYPVEIKPIAFFSPPMMLLITQIPSKITGSKQFFKLKKPHLPVNLSFPAAYPFSNILPAFAKNALIFGRNQKFCFCIKKTGGRFTTPNPQVVKKRKELKLSSSVIYFCQLPYIFSISQNGIRRIILSFL